VQNTITGQEFKKETGRISKFVLLSFLFYPVKPWENHVLYGPAELGSHGYFFSLTFELFLLLPERSETIDCVQRN